MPNRRPQREPLSEAHATLGRALRKAREGLGVSTRGVPGYSSGHISNVENGYAVPSEHVIAAYERIGADGAPLRGLLRAVQAESTRHKLARRHQAVGAIERHVTADSPMADIRATYDFEELEFLIRYDGAGVMTDVVVLATARAVAPPVELVTFAAYYIADPRPGVVSIEAIDGCRIVRRDANDTGAVAVVAELEEPIDGVHRTRTRYSYRINVDSTVRAQPLLREMSMKLRARQSYRLQFTPPAIPKRLWSFRTTDLVESFAAPNADDRVLRVDHNGFVSYEFEGVANEMIGLAWNW